MGGVGGSGDRVGGKMGLQGELGRLGAGRSRVGGVRTSGGFEGKEAPGLGGKRAAPVWVARSPADPNLGGERALSRAYFESDCEFWVKILKL